MFKPPVPWRRNSAAERHFQEGGRAGEYNQLGINKEPIPSSDYLQSKFISLKDNPKAENFYTARQFPVETVEKAQNKFYNLSQLGVASFEDERDNEQANRFLTAYSGAIRNGMIDRPVTPGGLDFLVQESATAGSNQSDPNTTTQFPSHGGKIA